jgi:hypothetical protein
MRYKILGYLFVFFVLAATVSLLYYEQVSYSVPEVFNSPVHKPHQQTPISTLETHVDPINHFQVQFDSSYIVDTENIQNYFRTKGQSLFSIALPQSLFPQTSFISASITFSVRPSTSASNCAYYWNGKTAAKIKDTLLFNQYNSYIVQFSTANPGKYIDTTLYHIPHDNLCLEINLTTQSSKNYYVKPDGTDNSPNASEITSRLNNILQSFKFTD